MKDLRQRIIAKAMNRTLHELFGDGGPLEDEVDSVQEVNDLIRATFKYLSEQNYGEEEAVYS